MFVRVRRSGLPVTAVILSLSASSASAGGLAPIWTGAYIGFHGGAKWSDIDTDFSSSLSATDATGGGHAGINFALGGIIVGVEADANLDSAAFTTSLAGGGSASIESDWSGTVRGRAGMTFGPAMFYATAGYAWTDASLSETTPAGGSFSSSHTFHGVVYGLGAETFVLPNISVRLEALRYDYGADKLSISGATAAAEEFDPSETVVRAGLTFHLN